MDTHPKWLRASKIPLTIVCGPPCSGKTTYVRGMSSKQDIVIDLDSIRMQLSPGYKPWISKYDEKLLVRAIRIRNLMLAKLATAKSGKAWFIVGAPSEKERQWWQSRLGGRVVLLNPGFPECRRRAHARGTPLAAAGVDAWEKRVEQAWHPPSLRRRIGLDGWYLEDVDEADVTLGRALQVE